jgi:hypothetical protein
VDRSGFFSFFALWAARALALVMPLPFLSHALWARVHSASSLLSQACYRFLYKYSSSGQIGSIGALGALGLIRS